ncbi:N-succinylarginine dihydrolase [Bacterioplanes sanyensis]|uniref:N-succinylarginine dihydrolase n=1 Tax=Bacterioplanes sanyensis TaxID=1249553 RepID=A0A222FDW9_9GAMM|nr:N-succinylarginine dihydrolase [Bacterioplanes sanyensis]ASP37287.1 N-succinylarginine dihydrolase [Bacterioplanes sanyensis]
MKHYEVNFDGLIGPSHHYGGLASGNLASHRNALKTSSPRQAALQGLEKMRTLIRLGYRQGFIPPQPRPALSCLRQLGFSGSDEEVIKQAGSQAPELLSMAYSASSMWAANAATVTPSSDSHDGKLHLTPANLVTTAHRSIEHPYTFAALQRIFHNPAVFSVHPALPATGAFADEGAANHGRLCSEHGQPGTGLFVWGRQRGGDTSDLNFPARQTLEASQAIARQHGVKQAVFLQQNAAAINAGAFHNDVVAVANGPVLFYHEQAYEAESQQAAFAQLRELGEFVPVCVPTAEVSLDEAIRSYLFNSQLLSGPDGDMSRMTLIAPTECQEVEAVAQYLQRLTADDSQPIRHVEFVDVRQSMSNGGGPACLRLRVLLSEKELEAVNPAFMLTEEKIDALQQWVRDHYRDSLHPLELLEPEFMHECHKAMVSLQQWLGCQDLYDGLM